MAIPRLLLPERTSYPTSVSVSASTADNIESLATMLSLPISLVLKLCVLASFATSIKWVREDYKKLCLGEIEEFDAWLATGFDIPSA